MRSLSAFRLYMKSSQADTEMPICFFTASASNTLRCDTFTHCDWPLSATARVLLHTTRTLVNCAVVASVPSQAVASRT